jgi:hypothetical protein
MPEPTPTSATLLRSPAWRRHPRTGRGIRLQPEEYEARRFRIYRESKVFIS